MVEQAPMKVEVDVIQDIAELPASEVAKLPASPVPQCIARDLILAAIDPTSSTGETIASIEVKTSDEPAGGALAGLADDHVEPCAVPDEAPISPPSESADKRQSTISDATSSNST